MFVRCAGATSMIKIVICTRCAGFYVFIFSQVHVYQWEVMVDDQSMLLLQTDISEEMPM